MNDCIRVDILKIIDEPIEGFFIKSNDNLIFDVKGLNHPENKIIAFVRYIPQKSTRNEKTKQESYRKLYSLSERYQFLSQNYPKYLFNDPQGRGILQAVQKDDLELIYNPILKLQQLMKKKKSNLTLLENQVVMFVNKILDNCDVSLDAIGITGSILVDLQKISSDIDFVIYGKENGREVYNIMPKLFKHVSKIKKYTKNELKKLWQTRGQTKQIDFNSFLHCEREKHLQGIFDNRDFYIRLVPLPSEFNELYSETKIKQQGTIEIKATISDDVNSIFTPCIYQLTDVEIINKDTLEETHPCRIFSLRGRYCELAKKGERIHTLGKLEKVTIKNRAEFHQIVLGSTQKEFFKKTH